MLFNVNAPRIFKLSMDTLVNAVRAFTVENNNKPGGIQADEFVQTTTSPSVHLAVLSNSSSSAQARMTARNALISMAGNSDSIRSEIVTALTARLNASGNSAAPPQETMDIAQILVSIGGQNLPQNVRDNVTEALLWKFPFLNNDLTVNIPLTIAITNALSHTTPGSSEETLSRVIRDLESCFRRDNPPEGRTLAQALGIIGSTLPQADAIAERFMIHLYNRTSGERVNAAHGLSHMVSSNLSASMRVRVIEALYRCCLNNRPNNPSNEERTAGLQALNTLMSGSFDTSLNNDIAVLFNYISNRTASNPAPGRDDIISALEFCFRTAQSDPAEAESAIETLMAIEQNTAIPQNIRASITSILSRIRN